MKRNWLIINLESGISLWYWNRRHVGSYILVLPNLQPMPGRRNNYDKQRRGARPKYLIRDRDSKYATNFSAVAAGSDIKELRSPYRVRMEFAKDSWLVCAENVWTKLSSRSVFFVQISVIRG